MSGDDRISEEMRGAFVDGQLDAEEWARVAERLERDPEMREEVCRLRAVKEMIRHAYGAAPTRLAASRRTAPGWKSLAAASLVFAIAGWFGHDAWNPPPAIDAASAYALRGDWHSLRQDWRSLDSGRVLVHVSSGGRESLTATLDEVEDLLRESRASKRHIEVEIVANGPGLDLLRASDEVFGPRLAALRLAHPELSLVACGQTMERQRAAGRSVELAPGTAVAPSALQEVVERLRTGWIYVRV